jgi:transcriptional regulator with XRE-family HTH domain
MRALQQDFTTTATRISPHSTFRLYLQAELARRCSNNPQYSLRSFALQLKIDHSTLSQILRGKRLVSDRMIAKLGARLALDLSTIDALILREKLRSAEARSSQGEIRQLAHDTVSLISNIYHYTILELIRLPEFKADSRWIARVLNLTVDEVNLALARLIRLGLLEMVAVDKWVDKSGTEVTTLEDFSHAAIQHLAQQVRNISSIAVSQGRLTLRERHATTIAIRRERLEQAREVIAKLEQELIECLATSDEHDDVYQLEIRLYPATDLKNQEDK